MNEDTIRERLTAANFHPGSIEANPATDGEWVVWIDGMGHPVHDEASLNRLLERCFEQRSRDEEDARAVEAAS